MSLFLGECYNIRLLFSYHLSDLFPDHCYSVNVSCCHFSTEKNNNKSGQGIIYWKLSFQLPSCNRFSRATTPSPYLIIFSFVHSCHVCPQRCILGICSKGLFPNDFTLPPTHYLASFPLHNVHGVDINVLLIDCLTLMGQLSLSRISLWFCLSGKTDTPWIIAFSIFDRRSTQFISYHRSLSWSLWKA